VIQPAAKTPRAYLPLLGVYARPGLGGWLIRLEWRDGKLTFTTPESAAWQVTLSPTSSPDMFSIASGAELAGEHVHFQHLPGGQIRSVHLMDTTWQRLEPPPAPN